MFKRPAVWLLRDSFTDHAVADVTEWLTLFSNDANKQNGTIKSWKGFVNHLLRRSATDAVVIKADEEIRNIA